MHYFTVHFIGGRAKLRETFIFRWTKTHDTWHIHDFEKCEHFQYICSGHFLFNIQTPINDLIERFLKVKLSSATFHDSCAMGNRRIDASVNSMENSSYFVFVLYHLLKWIIFPDDFHAAKNQFQMEKILLNLFHNFKLLFFCNLAHFVATIQCSCHWCVFFFTSLE